MRVRKNKFFPIIRLLALFVSGLVVAFVVTIAQVDMESVRGDVLNVLQDATGMPVEIDGAVSWKLSLRPRIELNQVRIVNADWAKNKYAFSAEKIDVRLNLISLLRDRPTIQNVRIYDAKVNIEKNINGQYSVPMLKNKPVNADATTVNSNPNKYPFKDAELGGVQVQNLVANIVGHRYTLAGFNIRQTPNKDRREYSGWIKIDTDVLPFIVAFDEYNADRRIYPMQIAMSTGGDALIANVALEGTSKMPIDFIVKGDVSDVSTLGRVFGLDLSGVPELSVNMAGGLDRQKLTLRKSSIAVRGTEFVVHGVWNWGKKIPEINANLYSKDVNLAKLFPSVYGGGRAKPQRKLNVFKDVPLYGDWLVNKNINLNIEFDKFVMYRDLDIRDLNLTLKVADNHARVDSELIFADGGIEFGIDADIEEDGHLFAQMALIGERVYVGEILREIHKEDFLSELPVNIEMYLQADGKNLAQMMSSVTGPVKVYSVAAGYAHSALVSYMYGTDFLTSLRHSIQDLFSSEKKYNQIKISCLALNAKLRDGLFQTQNGFAIETNAINIRLAGSLDLGNEEMQLSLTTLPVRGLKLSLTGNVVNSIELTGSLAEPDIKISGAAMASKVASATGLGLLLAPFTGGIGLVAGAGVGLLAGNLLENWLADDNPCKTALDRGAPLYEDDPDWLGQPMAELVGGVLKDQN